MRTAVLTGVLALSMAFAGSLAAGQAVASLLPSAKPASIVVDAMTGRVLVAENANETRHPASLAKMMTLYLLFDAVERGRIGMASSMPVSAAAARQPPSKLGLKPGTRVKVSDAMRLLIVKSANDLAVVVAEAVGGSEAKFARLMTDKARALGMSRTTFRNASGLHHAQQVTTAGDMAILAIALQRDFPRYYGLFANDSVRWRGRTFRSHNRFVGAFDGADGLKTGYIRASGFNLAASAERSGRRLVGVVFGGRSSDSRDKEMASVMGEGFRRAASSQVANLGSITASLGRHSWRAERTASIVQAREVLPPPRPGAMPPALSIPSDTFRLVSTASAATVPAAARANNSASSRAGSRPSGLGSGTHKVQVGAFGNRAAAEKIALQAVNALGGRFAQAQPLVETGPSGGRTIFRARLAGFDAASAASACAALKARKRDCLVVRDDAS